MMVRRRYDLSMETPKLPPSGGWWSTTMPKHRPPTPRIRYGVDDPPVLSPNGRPPCLPVLSPNGRPLSYPTVYINPLLTHTTHTTKPSFTTPGRIGSVRPPCLILLYI